MELNQPYYIEPRKGKEHIDLSGKWDFIWSDEIVDELGMLEWKYSATLPKSLYYNLFEAGILPAPYESTNSLKYDWVDEKIWYYRKKFYVSGELKNRNMYLCFDGVAYYCRVWVNGTLLGDHEGMFGGPVVDIEHCVRFDSENEIIVEVKACDYAEKERFDAWNKDGENTQIVPWNIARDRFTTKGDFIVVGIWNNVRIEALQKLHISRPYLFTKEINEEYARLSLEFELADGTQNELKPYCGYEASDRYNRAFDAGLSGAVTEKSVHIEIEICAEGKEVYGEAFDEALLDYEHLMMNADFKELQFITREILIPNPRLWYPNGMGEAFLYDVSIRVYQEHKLCDEQSFKTGIRLFEAERTAGRKYRTRWNDFHFKINEKKFFLKGINWMPIDFLYNIDKDEYEWCLRLAKNAGIQMLRVWGGGGMPETDAFYSLCDELGIMVWQDHLLNNVNKADHYPQKILESQEAYNLYRIRNHASLVMHCGGNEFNPYSERNAAAMFVISRIIKDLDGSRIYHYTTADRGSAHTYLDMEPVWFRHVYKELPFMAESGIHSFPSYNSLKKLICESELEQPIERLDSEEFIETHPELIHHFTEFKPDRIPRMMARASHISRVSDCSVADLCEATQAQAYEFYTILIQAMRENYPRCGGVLPWVFKRHWTTVGVQVVDGLGQPTYPYYAVRNSFAPLNVCLCLQWSVIAPYEEIPLKVKVFNQNNADIDDAQIAVTVYYPDMSVAGIQVKRYSPDMDEFDFEPFRPGEKFEDKAFLIAADIIQNNQSISRTVYFIRCTSLLKDCEVWKRCREMPAPNLFFEKGPWLKDCIQNAPKAFLNCKNAAVSKDSKYVYVEVTLENCSETAAFPVVLNTESQRYMATDNFFLLNAKETKKIRITMEQKENTMDETITISAWNSNVLKINMSDHILR